MKPESVLLFASTLREWRHRKGLRPEQAAKLLGVSESVYLGWEKAKRHPTPRQSQDIVEIAGLPLKIVNPTMAGRISPNIYYRLVTPEGVVVDVRKSR